MLRWLVVKNFVHFENETKLDFKHGPNFLIGRNSTGKSVLLELIRRCLSDKLNATKTSSLCDDNNPAYAFCLYENGEKRNENEFKSLLIGLFVEKSKGNHEHDIYKVAVVDTGAAEYTIFAKHTTENETSWHIGPIISTDVSFLNNIPSWDYYNKVIDIVKKSEDEHAKNTSWTNSGTTIDDLLEDMMPQFAATMPHRGISPVMVSSSIVHHDAEDLCKTTFQKANCFKELLYNKENINVDLANWIFQMICSDKYQFHINENTGEINFTSHGRPLPLIRVPEGVFEAKQLSLLLAHKRIKTLLLEEPFRGMHNEMVKKFTALVLQGITDKVVVIVSHAQGFISPWSLRRTYISRKYLSDREKVVHDVKKFPESLSKYGECAEMKTVLFASYVVFVEGETDKIILEALFNQILRDEGQSHDDKSSQSTGQIGELLVWLSQNHKMSKKQVNYALSQMEIVKLHGDKSGHCKHKFCDDLGICNVLLLDKNAILATTTPPPLKEQATLTMKNPSSIKENATSSPATPSALKKKTTSTTTTSSAMKKRTDLTTTTSSAFTEKAALTTTTSSANRDKTTTSTTTYVLKEIYIGKRQLPYNLINLKIQGNKDWNQKYKDIKNFLADDGIYVWKAGDIEDVMLSSVDKDSSIFTQMGLDKLNGKEHRKKWKSELKAKDTEKVEALALATIDCDLNKSEIAAFVAFVVQKCTV